MSNFNNNRSGGGSRFSSNKSTSREMYKATCSNCGRACEVPFKPSRPVLCSDCFEKSGNGADDSRRTGRSDFGRPNREDRPMFDAVCDSCGNTCKLPFQPRTGKPVFCSRCFEKAGESSSRRSDSSRNVPQPKTISSEQYEILNTKMDKILKILSSFQLAMDSEVTPEDLIGDPPLS